MAVSKEFLAEVIATATAMRVEREAAAAKFQAELDARIADGECPECWEWYCECEG